MSPVCNTCESSGLGIVSTGYICYICDRNGVNPWYCSECNTSCFNCKDPCRYDKIALSNADYSAADDFSGPCPKHADKDYYLRLENKNVCSSCVRNDNNLFIKVVKNQEERLNKLENSINELRATL